jgi:hypothetical protein
MEINKLDFHHFQLISKISIKIHILGQTGRRESREITRMRRKTGFPEMISDK